MKRISADGFAEGFNNSSPQMGQLSFLDLRKSAESAFPRVRLLQMAKLRIPLSLLI